MNAVDVKNLLANTGTDFNDAQINAIADKVKNVEFCSDFISVVALNCKKNTTPQKFIDLIFENRPRNQAKNNDGYISAPKLNDIPNYKQGKFVPCAVPKISIPHPNCQADSFKRYIQKAESLGLVSYVLAFFDNMFMIEQVKPWFLKTMQQHEFDYYYNQSKTLWERPSNWDEPAMDLNISYNEARKIA